MPLNELCVKIFGVTIHYVNSGIDEGKIHCLSRFRWYYRSCLCNAQGQYGIPAIVVPARVVYKVAEWLAYNAPQIKPVTWLRKLYKNDEAKILDAAMALVGDENAIVREKTRLKRSLESQFSDTDVSYYQNFSELQ